MHTFLATAYLIGESSILHLAAGPQKQLYWLNGFWKPLKCDFAENPSQSENPKGKYAFSRRTIFFLPYLHFLPFTFSCKCLA